MRNNDMSDKSCNNA